MTHLEHNGGTQPPKGYQYYAIEGVNSRIVVRVKTTIDMTPNVCAYALASNAAKRALVNVILLYDSALESVNRLRKTISELPEGYLRCEYRELLAELALETLSAWDGAPIIAQQWLQALYEIDLNVPDARAAWLRTE